MNDEVWIDYLSIINLCKFLNKKKVCYIGSSKIVQTLIKKFHLHQFQEISTISQSSNRIDDLSLYEYIQGQTTSLLMTFSDSPQIQKHIRKFELKFKINPVKLKAYLQEKFFYTSYRYNELLAYHTVTRSQGKIYLQRSTISPFLEIQGKEIIFYKEHLFRFFKKHHPRKDYFYDRFQEDYFFSLTKATIRLLLKEGAGVISLLISNIFLKKYTFNSPKIGIEVNRLIVDLTESNDLYWAIKEPYPNDKFLYFNLGTCEEKSLDVLRKTKAPILKMTQNFISVIKSMFNDNQNKGHRYIAPKIDYLLTLPQTVPHYIFNLFSFSKNKILNYYSLLYVTRSFYFYHLYKKMKINILWTMLDTDLDKLTKSQGLEWNNALYCGSHWSNFDYFRIDNQKTYDIIFTWGEHFIKNNFSHFPLQKSIITGYPSDHYFKAKKELAIPFRKKYADNFVISYHDNEVYNDLPNDIDSQRDMLNLLVKLLKKNSQLILLCKPKNKKRFDLVTADIDGLKELCDTNRITFFVGAPPEPKYPPATVGLMSDIAIGLGISTASAECHFAGTLGLHYDPCHFKSNHFASTAHNKYLFTQIEELEKSLQSLIDDPSRLEEYRESGKEIYERINKNTSHTCSEKTHEVMMEVYGQLASGESRQQVLNSL